MQEFIPQKQIKPRHVLSWVTHRIRKLIRAKQRLYSKLRQHHCPSNLGKYKEARHTPQREIRKSYWTYLENIIDYTTDEQDRHTKQNKFWSFIKQTHKDSSAIRPLRSQGEMYSEAQAMLKSLMINSVPCSHVKPLALYLIKGPVHTPPCQIYIYRPLASKNFSRI